MFSITFPSLFPNFYRRLFHQQHLHLSLFFNYSIRKDLFSLSVTGNSYFPNMQMKLSLFCYNPSSGYIYFQFQKLTENIPKNFLRKSEKNSPNSRNSGIKPFFYARNSLVSKQVNLPYNAMRYFYSY